MTDPNPLFDCDANESETLSLDQVARVKAAFLEASSKGLAERDEYIERHFGDEPEARDMLHRLLGAVDKPLPYETLADDIVVAHQQNRETATLGAVLPEERSRIGPYQLLERLGEGGFGVVYLAEQKTPVKRRIAIKVLKLGMDTKQVVARFEAERQALAMMEHPSIAKVFDAGATATGRPYFVMELVRGIPITTYCDSKQLGTRERLGLFVSVCHAIQHAHQKGIIHRDIKPSNVLVALHDGVPVPKVIDFGIAKATNSDLTEMTIYTRHREAIGTPAYMSPEQAEMSSLGIDTRSDIYSLGVLLYELLIGTTPLDMKSLSNAGYAEMIRMISQEEREKPSTRLKSLGDSALQAAEQRRTDIKKLGTLLRGDLDWIVMRCLEKDRTRRYDTANGLAADITRYLAHEPVTAGPPGAGYKLRKFVERNRARVLAGGILAAALLLGIVGTTYGMIKAIDEKDRADDAAALATRSAAAEKDARLRAIGETERAERELARATEIKRVLTEMLQSASPEAANAADTKLLRQVLRGVAVRLEKGEIQDELIAAELHHVIGNVLLSLQNLDEAELHCTRALEFRSRLLGDENPDTMRSLEAVAAMHVLRGRFGLAADLYRDLLDKRRRVLGKEDPDTIESMHDLGHALSKLGQNEAAQSILLDALDRSRRTLGPMHKITMGCMSDLAIVLTRLDRPEESELLFLETLANQQHVLGPEHPAATFTMNNLGILYRDAGRWEESESMHRSALQAQRNTYGSESDATKWTMILLAVVSKQIGRLDEAERLAIESLGGLRENPEYRPLFYDERMRMLASIYRDQGRAEEAERVLLELVEGLRAIPGSTEQERVLAAMRELSWFYTQTGRADDASEMQDRLREYEATLDVINASNRDS